MSSYSQTCIQMLFVRSSSTPSSDDKITIRKNQLSDDFEIIYTDPNCGVSATGGNTVKHTMRGMSHQDILDHMYFILKNQYLDNGKFSEIQISPPGMPRIIVDGDKFDELYCRDHFYELIDHCLHCLDITITNEKQASLPSTRSTPPGVRPQHLFFDE